MASSSRSSVEENMEGREGNDQQEIYIPLLRATLRGDWKAAENFFEQHESAFIATITVKNDTALHIAVETGKENIHFVEKLVALMPAEATAVKNIRGRTPLHIAALVGNTKAAALLVEKHPPALYMRTNNNFLPIHLAALYAQRDTLLYLWDLTAREDQMVLFKDQSGVDLLICLISSNFYDVALKLLERYPHLATLHNYEGESALFIMASKVSAYPSGSRLNFWQQKIYPYVPVKSEKFSIKDQSEVDDVAIVIPKVTSHSHKDNQAQSFGKNISILGHTASQNLQAILWKVLEFSAMPQFKHMQEEKLKHVQALQLVKTLCKNIRCPDFIIAATSMVQASSTGIPEVIEEICDRFPGYLAMKQEDNYNLIQLAVIRRQERVFNLIYQMGGHRYDVTHPIDGEGNNILHLAGRLAPANKLNLVPGAALQMQRELQWVEEVKKFVHPGLIESRNVHGETPEMVFTKSHEDLVAKGEAWMKGTANSCTITAALIVTVVFAAAITVPGGNDDDTGLPIFSHKVAFIVFAVSDAISLFTSATSLLMFLSILTSRYAEGDFLHVLPKRLITGLFTLFLSITTMMVAFSCALYLVLGQNKMWILIPVAVLACLPITTFITLQFPLLVSLISSTYGKGIFGKQSDRPLY